MYQNDASKVMTGKTRFSYVHLLKPYSHDAGKDPKYSVTLLIPKTDTATKAQIDAAIAAATADGKANKWNGVVPPVVATPVWDGDGVRPSGEPFGEECHGMWVLTASSKQRPGVVDVNVQPIIDENEIYSGMFGRATIRFFAYASNGKKGIGCGLNNVQKLGDGDALGGHTSAANDFGKAPAYGPGAGYQTPAQPQYNAPAYPQNPAPAYTNPATQYPQGQPGAINPVTGQPMNYGYTAPAPAQPQTPAPQGQPGTINPITGQPMNGGIMGV